MNFTREPIIETIVSPKEGYKLLVRNSKGGNQEEYFVDAVEVVSFGHSLFFRCLEKPKEFLVPVSDYEILEVKEARVVLKNVGHERNIKIGGGRDAPVRTPRELPVEKEAAFDEEIVAEEESESPQDNRPDRKRDRHRRRRRRSSSEDGDWQDRRGSQEQHAPKAPEPPRAEGEGGGAADEAKVSSTIFSTLFPPPPTLISETISRYKDKEFADSSFFTKPVEPKKEAEKTDDLGSDSTSLHRVSTYGEPPFSG